MIVGPYQLSSNVLLAPMAGVTDRPFRVLCRQLGAGLTTSEMVTADPRLLHTRKTRLRLDHHGEAEPVSVQIAGADPEMLAEAARRNVDGGAQIIDINMGCPAKKVCNAAAGSALLREEVLVGRILEAVVDAVAVPVTLKLRTGWDATMRNGVRIARLAEACGIQALAVHGRTRADGFSGSAEFETIREIKSAVGIPVAANGDVDSPEKAAEVLTATGADAVMIGRAAQGRPWIFSQIAAFLSRGERLPEPDADTVGRLLLGHLDALYDFYGGEQGVRVARKHIRWFCASRPGSAAFWARVSRAESSPAQRRIVESFFVDLQSDANATPRAA
jgi:tRNA-dihydrouridine synthase B